jgi:metallophosphoesterase (TIGR00282 family)
MKILFIGDIVGKPGRQMVKHHLPIIKVKYEIDFVIANYENASHGFGLTTKNYKELKNSGIDVMTGGNHTFDKRKEIIEVLKSDESVLRPCSYFEAEGKCVYKAEINNEKIAIINLMGIFSMPYGRNPFIDAKEIVENLINEGYRNIFIDFHAEATAEKQAMFMMLKEKISAIIGTHTHVGTDDLEINQGCCYLTDIGLTGCRDNVIGMKEDVPIKRFLTGLGGHYDVPDNCKKLFQAVVVDIQEGNSVEAFKLKAYDFEEAFISQEAKFE